MLMNLTNRFVQRLALAMLLLAMGFGLSVAHAVTYEMVTVANPGNAANTNDRGSVNYSYQIGKYEVTIGQYVEFLNSVAKTDTFGLYKSGMGSDWNANGITRSGSPGSYVYESFGVGSPDFPGLDPKPVRPVGADSVDNRPIAYIDWYGAARFSNWMANGQPTGNQTSTTTEDGAYAISGTTTAPSRNAVNPNTGATPLFSLPTENEWYKAAFYSPVLNSGSGGYWYSPAQSNSDIGNQIGSTNSGNVFGVSFSVTQSFNYSQYQNYLTNVGAFVPSASFYGTYDQGGNVSEWNDLLGASGTVRGQRGGNWSSSGGTSIYSSGGSAELEPSFSAPYTGFRLASPVPVPEPSTWVMGLAGIACAGWGAFRRRNRA
jgi:formylglycine-generating enzyme required for sulfatase activity